MASFGEIVQKKFLGVKVVYWGLAAVTILAYFAWKSKAFTPSTPTDTTGTDTTGDNAADMSSLNTTGTVVVQPTTQVTTDAEDETNSKWLASAIDYIVNTKKMATIGDAQLALTQYINGEDLTYAQGQIRDEAVIKLGLPPEGVAKVGITASKPAQKQFSNFPGKHTVKGSNDNTASKLAQLYYGSGDALHANRISEMNTSLGPNTVTFSTGTVVTIPAYANPNYYTVTGKNSDQYSTALAKKFGLTTAQLIALNPGVSYPVKIGTKIRTQ